MAANEPVTMSPSDAAASLAAAEDATAAVFAVSTPTPRWAWITIGIMGALLFASYDTDLQWLQITANVLYAMTVGATVAIVAKRRGVQAKFTRIPGSMKRMILTFIAGSFVAVGAVAAVVSLFDGPPRWTIAGIIIGGGFAFGATWWERRLIAAHANAEPQE